uniref:Nucleolar protein 58 n=1 Tax=Cacopsylla melanoneura TaxID=428564 RepID=A0A8D8TUS2_9HEMI
MLVLFETPAGYAFFKLLDEKKLQEADNLYESFQTPQGASKILKLKHFEKFLDTTEALAATTAAVEGKLCKKLKKVVKSLVSSDLQENLLVADAKLGNAIKDKLSIACVSNTNVHELMRCIRTQADSLLGGLPKKELTAMALGLAHSLSRYKLKFSPDKVDTMIVQAVSLLDDLDKELNNYMMRCREWYGWHFPELGKIVTDNVAFVKTIKTIGTRDKTSTSDLSEILPEDVEEKVKEAAEISMGTEISDDDIENILLLCDQVLEISNYRGILYDYLRSRMMAVAPNLTILMGELVGARLVAQAGSLLNLAKHPASTVQILGAEKALFRALKTKRDTPKYGLIYHSQLIGQASTKNKGKMARMLAAKASLATRVDALGEDSSIELGTDHRAKLEIKLRLLEEGNLRRLSGTSKAKAKLEKYHGKSEIHQYSAANDSTLPVKRKFDQVKTEPSDDTPQKKKFKIEDEEEAEVGTPSSEKKKKKKKNKQGLDTSVEVKSEPVEEADEDTTTPSKKKKKKNKRSRASKEKVEPPAAVLAVVPETAPSVCVAQPNVSLVQPDVAASHQMAPLSQPNIVLAQTTVPFTQSNMSLVQPNVPLAQPNLAMAQPTVPLVQSSITMAQPNVSLTQPNVPLTQSNVPLELIELQNFQISENMFKESESTTPENDFNENDEESFSLNDVITESSLFEQENEPTAMENEKNQTVLELFDLLTEEQKEREKEKMKDKTVNNQTKKKWTELDRLHYDLMENFKDVANISSVRSCRKKQSETPSPPNSKTSPNKLEDKKTSEKHNEDTDGNDSQPEVSKDSEISELDGSECSSVISEKEKQIKKIKKKKKKRPLTVNAQREKRRKKVLKRVEFPNVKTTVQDDTLKTLEKPENFSAKNSNTEMFLRPKVQTSLRETEAQASSKVESSLAESEDKSFKSPPTVQITQLKPKGKRSFKPSTPPVRRSLRSTATCNEDDKQALTSDTSSCDGESVDTETESKTEHEIEAETKTRTMIPKTRSKPHVPEKKLKSKFETDSSDTSDVEHKPQPEPLLYKKPGPKSKTRGLYFENVPIEQPSIVIDNEEVAKLILHFTKEKEVTAKSLDETIFNDTEYYFSGKSTCCKLCKKKKFTSRMMLTQHYKQIHTDLDIVPSSRLPKDVAKIARLKSVQNELEFLENVDLVESNCPVEDSGKRIYKPRSNVRQYACNFCVYNRATKFEPFLSHVSFHTGEYRYKCPVTNCQTSSNWKRFVNTHIKEKHGDNEIPIEVYKCLDKQMDLFGYLCKLCNYVQLLKSNIRKHFTLGHGNISDIEEHIMRIDMSNATPDKSVSTTNEEAASEESRFTDLEFPTFDIDDNVDSDDADSNSLVGSSVLNEIMQDFMKSNPGEVMNFLLDDDAFNREEGKGDESLAESGNKLETTREKDKPSASLDKSPVEDMDVDIPGKDDPNKSSTNQDESEPVEENAKKIKSQAIQDIVASIEDLANIEEPPPANLTDIKLIERTSDDNQSTNPPDLMPPVLEEVPPVLEIVKDKVQKRIETSKIEKISQDNDICKPTLSKEDKEPPALTHYSDKAAVKNEMLKKLSENLSTAEDKPDAKLAETKAKKKLSETLAASPEVNTDAKEIESGTKSEREEKTVKAESKSIVVPDNVKSAIVSESKSATNIEINRSKESETTVKSFIEKDVPEDSKSTSGVERERSKEAGSASKDTDHSATDTPSSSKVSVPSTPSTDGPRTLKTIETPSTFTLETVPSKSSLASTPTTEIPSTCIPRVSTDPVLSPRRSTRKLNIEPQLRETLKKLEIKKEPDNPFGAIQYTDEERRKMWLDQMDRFYETENLYRPKEHLRKGLADLLERKRVFEQDNSGEQERHPEPVVPSEIPSHDHDYSTATAKITPLAVQVTHARKLPDRNCKLNIPLDADDEEQFEVASEYLPHLHSPSSGSDVSLVNPAEVFEMISKNQKTSIALKLASVLSATTEPQPDENPLNVDMFIDTAVWGNNPDTDPDPSPSVTYTIKIKAGMVSVSLSPCYQHIKYTCDVPQCAYTVTQLDDFYNHVHTLHEDTPWNGWCSHCPKKELCDETLLMAVAHLHVNHLINDFNITNDSVPSMLDFLKTTSFKPASVRSKRSSSSQSSSSGNVASSALSPNSVAGGHIEEPGTSSVRLRIRTDIFSKMKAERPECELQEENVTAEDEEEVPDFCPIISSVTSLKSSAAFSLDEPSVASFSIDNPLDSAQSPITVTVPTPDQLEHETILKRLPIPALDSNAFSRNKLIHLDNQFPLHLLRTKYPECLKQQLLPTMIGLGYKCSSDDCDYSTGDGRQFIFHVGTHTARYRVRKSRPGFKDMKNWDRCCYCGKRYTGNIPDLVTHIKQEHGHCVYQCAYCFYRAYTQVCVFWHQEYAHSDLPIRLYITSPLPEADLYGFPPVSHSSNLLKSTLSTYVHPYWCVDCEFSTYLLKTFLTHFSSQHAGLSWYGCGLCKNKSLTFNALLLHYKHIHRNALWHCAYCAQSCDTFEVMQVHVITQHAQLVPHCVIRCSKAGKELNHTQDDLMIITLSERALTSSELISLEVEDNNAVQVIDTTTSCSTANSATVTTTSTTGTTTTESSTHLPPSTSSTNTPTCTSLSSSEPPSTVSTTEAAAAPPTCSKPRTKRGDKLYRCGNSGCNFGAPDARQFKDHMMCCDHFRNQQGGSEALRLRCYHCERTFVNLTRLLEHVEKHGAPKYRCGLCSFQHPTLKAVSFHVKKAHSIKIELTQETYHRGKPDEFYVLFPKGVNNTSRLGAAPKVGFSLDDLDTLSKLNPTPSVALLCSSCGYRANTTLNLIRHLREGKHIVTKSDLTNDIPCLNTGDLMFNKMTNHALSSNLEPRQSLPEETNYEKIPKFVPINKRYVCTFCNPQYLSQDELIFKHHFSSLHSDETIYVCPHCPANMSSEPITIDKIGVHLKFHGGKLFKCSYCNFVHHARHLIDRHLGEMHGEAEPSWVVLRDVNDTAEFDDTRAPSIVHPGGDKATATTPVRKWKCNLCKMRYADVKAMRKHLLSHRFKHQFKCVLCEFSADESPPGERFEQHFKSEHPEFDTSRTVLALFSLIPPSSSKDSTGQGNGSKRLVASTPSDLYKLRSDQPITSIRGIELETAQRAHSNIAHTTVLETQDEMFGSHGEPAGSKQFQCPKCARFRTPDEAGFREHLYKENNYHRWSCNHCSHKCLRHKDMLKHHSTMHAQFPVSDSLAKLPENSLLQGWVNRVIDTQLAKMIVLAAKSAQAAPASSLLTANQVESATTDTTPAVLQERRGRPPKFGPGVGGLGDQKRGVEEIRTTKKGAKRKLPADLSTVPEDSQPQPQQQAHPVPSSSPQCEVIDIEDDSDEEGGSIVSERQTPTPSSVTSSPGGSAQKRAKFSILRGETTPSKQSPTRVVGANPLSKALFTPSPGGSSSDGRRDSGTWETENHHATPSASFTSRLYGSTAPALSNKRPLTGQEVTQATKRIKTVAPPPVAAPTSELMKKNEAIKSTLKPINPGIVCRDCGQKYRTIMGLKTHIRHVHYQPNLRKYFCQYCDLQLDADTKLTHFHASHPGLEPKVTGYDPYQKIQLTDKFWLKEYGICKYGYVDDPDVAEMLRTNSLPSDVPRKRRSKKVYREYPSEDEEGDLVGGSDEDVSPSKPRNERNITIAHDVNTSSKMMDEIVKNISQAPQPSPTQQPRVQMPQPPQLSPTQQPRVQMLPRVCLLGLEHCQGQPVQR